MGRHPCVCSTRSALLVRSQRSGGPPTSRSPKESESSRRSESRPLFPAASLRLGFPIYGSRERAASARSQRVLDPSHRPLQSVLHPLPLCRLAVPGSRAFGGPGAEGARQAHELGCRLFALTGGEPFVHREVGTIVQEILRLPDTHVAVLTNGLAARTFLEKHRWSPERVHLQVSLDGLEERHDAVRGKGTFEKTVRELRALARMGFSLTLSMCPTRSNLADVPLFPHLARDVGACNIHFMWYFVRGRGVPDEWVPTDGLFTVVRGAAERAESLGVSVDNVRALASQVFAPPGTRFDGTGMTWESLALGPDGNLYPSAALVGVSQLAVPRHYGLEKAWRGSPLFERIRRETAAELDHPLRFLLGGRRSGSQLLGRQPIHGRRPLHGSLPKAGALAHGAPRLSTRRHPWAGAAAQDGGRPFRLRKRTARCHLHSFQLPDGRRLPVQPVRRSRLLCRGRGSAQIGHSQSCHLFRRMDSSYS
ncbi:MAG: radical SAM protein [Desulfosoma sp.]|uniref:radical SAM protein n=1 Tax=Desulfosoma sp. TaxID=2603217 RepID=UPI00404AB181